MSINESYLDVDTAAFLISLKATNYFWYKALMACAKKSVKLTKQCLKDIQKFLTIAPALQQQARLANSFQICRFARDVNAVPANVDDIQRPQSWDSLVERVSLRILTEQKYNKLHW